jgi:hypothetical protein
MTKLMLNKARKKGMHFVILAFYHPHFSIRILSSTFYHPHFIIRILSSAFFYPPSAIRHPPPLISLS